MYRRSETKPFDKSGDSPTLHNEVEVNVVEVRVKSDMTPMERLRDSPNYRALTRREGGSREQSRGFPLPPHLPQSSNQAISRAEQRLPFHLL